MSGLCPIVLQNWAGLGCRAWLWFLAGLLFAPLVVLAAVPIRGASMRSKQLLASSDYRDVIGTLQAIEQAERKRPTAT